RKETLLCWHAALGDHLQDIRCPQRQGLGDGRSDLVGVANTLTSHTHAMGNLNEIQHWLREVQMRIRSPSGELQRAPIAVHVDLENAIGVVAQDQVDDRDMMMRRGPEALHRIHRGTVSPQRYHWLVRMGELDPQGAWQPLADTATMIAKHAARALQWEGA